MKLGHSEEVYSRKRHILSNRILGELSPAEFPLPIPPDQIPPGELIGENWPGGFSRGEFSATPTPPPPLSFHTFCVFVNDVEETT